MWYKQWITFVLVISRLLPLHGICFSADRASNLKRQPILSPQKKFCTTSDELFTREIPHGQALFLWSDCLPVVSFPSFPLCVSPWYNLLTLLCVQKSKLFTATTNSGLRIWQFSTQSITPAVLPLNRVWKQTTHNKHVLSSFRVSLGPFPGFLRECSCHQIFWRTPPSTSACSLPYEGQWLRHSYRHPICLSFPSCPMYANHSMLSGVRGQPTKKVKQLSSNLLGCCAHRGENPIILKGSYC